MMRKDTLGTDERPHYYSKFWIEVALGQAGITPQHAVETAEPEAEFDEYEAPEPEPELELPKPAPKPAAKPKAEKKPESRPVLTSLADLANIDKLMQDSAAMDAAEIPDIENGGVATGSCEHQHLAANQLGREHRQAIVLTIGVTINNRDILAFNIASFS